MTTRDLPVPVQLLIWKAQTTPCVTVVCIGPAGFGAAYWQPLSTVLPAWIQLVALRLAGRESRLAEPPCQQLHAAVADLHQATIDHLRAVAAPVLMVGVCSGAALAYEMAIALRQSDVNVEGLILVERPKPTADPQALRLQSLPARELALELAGEGGIPAVVAQDPELFALFEPMIRADLRMDALYAPRTGTCLDVRTTLVLSQDGQPTADRALAAWAPYLKTPPSTRVVAADELVLLANPTMLHAPITDCAKDLLAG